MAAYLKPVDKGRPVVLDKAIMLIGRHPECDVVLTNSRKISRRHCCIVQVDGELFVRDLGSMNGVRVNGKRIRKEAPLAEGDKLTLGDVCYVIVAGKPKSRSPQQKQNEDAESIAASSHSSSESPGKPIDISQNFPVPLPEEEIPDIEIEEKDLLLNPADAFEERVLEDTPDSDVIMIEDSDEFEGHGSEIEIIPE